MCNLLEFLYTIINVLIFPPNKGGEKYVPTHIVGTDLYLAFLTNIMRKFNSKLHKSPLGNGMILKYDQIYTDK